MKTKGIEVKYEVILVETEDQSGEYKFSGSPSILVDGVDVDPMARNVKSYSVSSCRPYFYQGKSSDYQHQLKKLVDESIKYGRSLYDE